MYLSFYDLCLEDSMQGAACMNGTGSIAFVVFRSMRIQATLGGTFVSIVILLHLRDGAAQINVPRSGFTIHSSISPSRQVRHVNSRYPQGKI